MEFDIKRVMEEIQTEALLRIPEEEKLPHLADLVSPAGNTDSDPFELIEYNQQLSLINQFWNTPATPTIIKHSGIIGNLKYLLKRLIRKLLFWFISPIVQGINENMARNVNLHNQTSRFIALTRQDLVNINARISLLQDQLDRMESSARKETT